QPQGDESVGLPRPDREERDREPVGDRPVDDDGAEAAAGAGDGSRTALRESESLPGPLLLTRVRHVPSLPARNIPETLRSRSGNGPPVASHRGCEPQPCPYHGLLEYLPCPSPFSATRLRC